MANTKVDNPYNIDSIDRNYNSSCKIDQYSYTQLENNYDTSRFMSIFFEDTNLVQEIKSKRTSYDSALIYFNWNGYFMAVDLDDESIPYMTIPTSELSEAGDTNKPIEIIGLIHNSSNNNADDCRIREGYTYGSQSTVNGKMWVVPFITPLRKYDYDGITIDCVGPNVWYVYRT